MLAFAAANTPMKMVSSAARIIPITQPRTLRNLVHSARSTAPKPPWDPSSRHLLPGVRVKPGRAELDGLAGQLQVGLLQGHPLGGDLGERHCFLAEHRDDALRRQSRDREHV